MLTTHRSTTQPDIDVTNEFAQVHLTFFTNEILSIQSQLNQTVYKISVTRYISYRLHTLPREIEKFRASFILSEEQQLAILKLLEKVQKLSKKADDRLKYSIKERTPRRDTTTNRGFLNWITRSNTNAGIHFQLKQPNDNSPNDELLLVIFAFLSFGDLANCLRVNNYFNQVTRLSPVLDGSVTLDRDRTVFLDLDQASKKLRRRPEFGEIVDARQKAIKLSSLRFWKTTKGKLDVVPKLLKEKVGEINRPHV